MTDPAPPRTDEGNVPPAIGLGVALLLIGIALFIGQLFDVGIDDVGWPAIVIGIGVVILVLGLFVNHEQGMVIGGTVATTVGLVLLYQNNTGHWESWAYAWALVGPGAAGLGMLVYGLIFGQRDLLSAGARLVAIAAAIFVAGYWYFETVFATGQAPLELGQWWPVVVVGAGLLALVAGFLGRGSRNGERRIHPSTSGDVR